MRSGLAPLLLPTGANSYARADAKLDSKHQLPLLNELCDLSNCNNALFFEARRKHGDLYLWAAKAPNGPSIRFHVLNAHTMDELKMTGNCLKGSRPIVVFDKAFDESPHFMVIKEVLMNVSWSCEGQSEETGADGGRASRSLRCRRRRGGQSLSSTTFSTFPLPTARSGSATTRCVDRKSVV
mgnify:CR=1 FL=1